MAVYTKISQSDLESLLVQYDIGKLKTFSGIAAGIQNSNFILDTENNRYVLTIYEHSVNEKDLPFFLDLMGHFSSKGIPCPTPIKNNSGLNISHIKDKPCAIVSFVKGFEVTNASLPYIEELGRNIAKMHLAGADFPLKRANEIGLEGWRKKFDSVKDRAEEISPGLKDEISQVREWLNSQWPKNLPSGVIHGDIFPDNVLFASDGKIAGIIDFYFACDDIFMYDLAICINAWCFDTPAANKWEFNKSKANALVSSYNSVRKISGGEFQALPLLATGAAMRFLLTRMHAKMYPVNDALVHTKNPLEYLYKLRFHKEITSYREYGIEIIHENN